MEFYLRIFLPKIHAAAVIPMTTPAFFAIFIASSRDDGICVKMNSLTGFEGLYTQSCSIVTV